MKNLKLFEEFMEESFRDKFKASKDKLVKKAKEFGKALKEEGKETKEAFDKIKDSIKNGEKLSAEDKKMIKKQMGDVLKTAGLTAATFLPGGFIYLALTQNKHTKDYTLPSSFKESNDDSNLDYLK